MPPSYLDECIQLTHGIDCNYYYKVVIMRPGVLDKCVQLTHRSTLGANDLDNRWP